jgi:hypothetical protein
MNDDSSLSAKLSGLFVVILGIRKWYLPLINSKGGKLNAHYNNHWYAGIIEHQQH